MKFWLKIVIAFSIVVVLGFGAWAFFFRVKDDVATYNKVCELIDYKQSINLKEKINELKLLDYTGTEDKIKPIDDSTEVKKSILNLREYTMSSSNITYYDDGGNLTCVYDSHYVLEEISNDMIKYLLPYLKYSNSNAEEYKAINDCVNEYVSDLKELDTSIALVKENQSQIVECTDIEFEILYGKYKSFYNKYRKTLNDSARLINLMIVNIRSDIDNFKCDTEFALIDSFSRALKVSTAVDDKREPLFAYDLHFIIDKYNKVLINDDIFTAEYSEYKFLTSYNNLIDNHSDVFDKVLQKHNLEKKRIADGENLSDIVSTSHESIITVLNILGF